MISIVFNFSSGFIFYLAGIPPVGDFFFFERSMRTLKKKNALSALADDCMTVRGITFETLRQEPSDRNSITRTISSRQIEKNWKIVNTFS